LNLVTGIADDRKLKLTVGAIVLGFSVFWFYFPARYVLFANQDVTLFLTTSDYLLPFLKIPGGLLEYNGSFLSQILRFRLPGALLLASMVAASYYLSVQLFRRISVNRPAMAVTAGVVAAALFVAMHNYYPHRVHQSLGMILAMILADLVPRNTKGMRIFLILSIPLFYVICGGFVWVFLLVWIARDTAREGKIKPEWLLWGIFYPAVVVFISGRLVYIQPIRDLLLNPLPIGLAYGRIIWPLLFTGWIIMIPILARITARFQLTGYRRIIPASLSLAVSIMAISFSYNRKNAEFFTIEKFALEKDWGDLLQFVDDHPSGNLFGTYYTNLALLEEGRLCVDLFKYPQPFGRRGLCFEWESKGEVLRRGSDFFWAIGFVNEARHWAFESMIVEGITRRNLRRLIQAELVSGNLEVAAKYIGLMDRTLFDRSLERHYRTFLEDPESIRSDPELGPRAGIKIYDDFFADGFDLEKNLKSMLLNEARAKPVLDYLMAIYLLERRVDNLAELLPDYLKASPGELPVLLEEALVIYKITHREDNMTNIRVTEPTLQRFKEYTGILRRYKNKNEAATVMYPEFGNTFWFYYNFSDLFSD
jgi:hypothetical protein